jgi:acyl-CoA dehydrogenase
VINGESSDSVTAPYLTAEDAEFRRYVRSELESAVLPNAEEWEKEGKVPKAAWRDLAGRGVLRFGHTGADFLRSAIFLEEVGRTGYAGVRAAIAVHSYMALYYLEQFGTAEQRQRYVSSAREGIQVAALAVSEAEGGSDLRHIGTRAERASDGSYRVNGEKSYVVNGSVADFYVTLVKTRQSPASRVLTGASILLIDANTDGITRSSQPMVGWRSADICAIRFADVAVPADRLVGRVDQALIQLTRALDFERLVAGLLALGGVGYSLDLLATHVGSRKVHDAPLGSNQFIRQAIADMRAEYEILRHYAYHAAWLQSRDRLDSRTSSILKLKATELAVTVAQKCVQYHGARGYLTDSPAGRLYCDAIGGTIAGGASELLREMIYQLS